MDLKLIELNEPKCERVPFSIVLKYLLFVLTIFSATSAYAACTNPAGNEAEMEFFTDTNEYKFCNGTEWVVQGGGAADCADDDTATCTLDNTRANSDPDFIASNIAPGVTILGVTGTYVLDNEPDAFSFTDQSDVSVSTIIQSNIVQITNMDNNRPLSISGDGSPAYRICNDATCSTAPSYTSSPGLIDDGQYVQLRLNSSSSSETTFNATITIGSVSDQWTVTTETVCDDPYWDNVVLHLDFNGDYTDNSASNHSPSNTGTTIGSGAFGGGAYFNGSAYLSYGDSDSLSFGSGDFTIEMWVTSISNNNYGRVISKGTEYWMRTGTPGGEFGIETQVGSIWNGAITGGSWRHIAISRVGGTLYSANNGTVVSTSASGSFSNTSTALMIGRDASGTAYQSGYVDEVRITKGVGRYTTSFTPAGPFPVCGS